MERVRPERPLSSVQTGAIQGVDRRKLFLAYGMNGMKLTPQFGFVDLLFRPSPLLARLGLGDAVFNRLETIGSRKRLPTANFVTLDVTLVSTRTMRPPGIRL